MRGAALLIVVMAGVGRAAAAADDPPICAARPGKSTPPCTVPAGHFQLETGLADWSLQKGQGERDTSLVIGETTFKYGLDDRSDIEVDVTLAYKRQLTAPGGSFQVAIMPFVKAPTARRSLGNGEWEAGVLVPIGFSIADSPFSVGLTPEVDWVADGDGHGHHAAMAQVASIGLQASDKLSLSADLWGQWDWDPAGTTRQETADASVAYLVSDSLQLDGGANIGLNRQSPDVELYAGVSKRF